MPSISHMHWLSHPLESFLEFAGLWIFVASSSALYILMADSQLEEMLAVIIGTVALGHMLLYLYLD